jgi:putative N6-adenine-specific DNA methylase
MGVPLKERVTGIDFLGAILSYLEETGQSVFFLGSKPGDGVNPGVAEMAAEKMKEKYKKNWFDEKGPVYPIEVSILKDIVTLTIDTSGFGLHKRGYRKLQAAAPLRETLAAAMVMLTRWKPDRQFIDPLCGSGTIPIEAALIGQNIAPGMLREFAFNQWPNISPALFQRAREEARDLADRSRPLHIIGTDIDEEVLSLARYHARQAGVEGQIHFQRQPLAEIRSHQKFGFLARSTR